MERGSLQAMSEGNEKDPLLGQPGRLGERGSVQGKQEEVSSDLTWLQGTRLPPGKTSPWGAVFIIVNAALGAGLLTFPVAFYSAGGVAPSLSVMAFLLVWIVVGLLVLAHLAEIQQAGTYEDVVGGACGPIVKAIVDFCIIIYTFGTSIAFLVVIGDQLQDLSAAVYIHGHSVQGKWWVDRRLFISLTALLFILPWLWMKKIGVLSYTSFLGVLCCGYICLVVAVRYFVPFSDQTPANMTCDRTIPLECSRQWQDFFTAIPYICFGYQCHVSSVPIYAGLKRRSMKNYIPVVAVALSICVLVYTVTGVFGYLTFLGHSCFSPDILRNYCPQDPAVDVARVMLILVMITSYPILAFCGRTALDFRVQQLLRRLSPGTAQLLARWERLRMGMEGTLWLLLSLVLALFVPQISYVINPIGGLAAVLMFVFPAMGWLHMTLGRRSLRMGRLAVVGVVCGWLLVLGTFVFGTSVVYNVMLDFHAL